MNPKAYLYQSAGVNIDIQTLPGVFTALNFNAEPVALAPHGARALEAGDTEGVVSHSHCSKPFASVTSFTSFPGFRHLI